MEVLSWESLECCSPISKRSSWASDFHVVRIFLRYIPESLTFTKQFTCHRGQLPEVHSWIEKKKLPVQHQLRHTKFTFSNLKVHATSILQKHSWNNNHYNSICYPLWFVKMLPTQDVISEALLAWSLEGAECTNSVGKKACISTHGFSDLCGSELLQIQSCWKGLWTVLFLKLPCASPA